MLTHSSKFLPHITRQLPAVTAVSPFPTRTCTRALPGQTIQRTFYLNHDGPPLFSRFSRPSTQDIHKTMVTADLTSSSLYHMLFYPENYTSSSQADTIASRKESIHNLLTSLQKLAKDFLDPNSKSNPGEVLDRINSSYGRVFETNKDLACAFYASNSDIDLKVIQSILWDELTFPSTAELARIFKDEYHPLAKKFQGLVCVDDKHITALIFSGLTIEEIHTHILQKPTVQELKNLITNIENGLKTGKFSDLGVTTLTVVLNKLVNSADSDISRKAFRTQARLNTYQKVEDHTESLQFVYKTNNHKHLIDPSS